MASTQTHVVQVGTNRHQHRTPTHNSARRIREGEQPTTPTRDPRQPISVAGWPTPPRALQTEPDGRASGGKQRAGKGADRDDDTEFLEWLEVVQECATSTRNTKCALRETDVRADSVLALLSRHRRNLGKRTLLQKHPHAYLAARGPLVRLSSRRRGHFDKYYNFR